MMNNAKQSVQFKNVSFRIKFKYILNASSLSWVTLRGTKGVNNTRQSITFDPFSQYTAEMTEIYKKETSFRGKQPIPEASVKKASGQPVLNAPKDGSRNVTFPEPLRGHS